MLLSVPSPLAAQRVTALMQGANGSVGLPLSPVFWTAGALNASKAHFTEGMSLPYRLEVTDLQPGQPYCVTIGWDTRQKGRPAIDFLTSYDRTAGHDAFGHPAELIDPLQGTTLGGWGLAPQYAPLPAPSAPATPVPGQPAAAFEALPAAERRLAIFNGRISGVRYVSEASLEEADATAALEVCFELLPGGSTPPSVVLAWGGHFAAAADWGADGGASSIPGGTIKTFLVDCAGLAGCGTRVVSIQPSAIASQSDCSISGPASICPGSEAVFSALGAGAGRVSWQLVNNEAGVRIQGPKNKQTVTLVSGEAGGYVDLELTVDQTLRCTHRIYVLDGADFGLSPSTLALCAGAAPATIRWTGLEEPSVTRTFRVRDARGRLLAKGLEAEALAALLSQLAEPVFVYGFVRPEFDRSCGVETEPVAVNLWEAPVADFRTGPACAGRETAFEDRSTGATIVAWDWDFAGLGASREQHPVFTFPAPGAYEVTLTVTDDAGCQGATTRTVVIGQPPEPDFSIDGDCSSRELTFTNLSRVAGDDVAYAWDFGDGTPPSAEKDPVHVYQEGGSYLVQLRVTDSNGCSTALAREVNIRQAPVPGFSVSTLCTGQEARFTNATVAGDRAVILYEWQFGDGLGSLQPEPEHTYQAPGTYTVVLTATDAAGCRAVYEETVEVIDPPDAAFDAAGACRGESISFTSTSTAGSGTIVAYRWQFGDGKESEEAAPEHQYEAAGTYEVTLTVTNEFGCSDTYAAPVTVFPPVAIAAGADLAVCEDGSIQLDGSVGGGAVRALWSDNGAGGTFRPRASILQPVYFPPAGYTGTLTLTLTSEDPEGPCPARSDALALTVYPATVVEAGPDRSACAGMAVELAGAVSGAAAAWADGGAGGRFEPDAGTLDARYFPAAGVSGAITLTLTSDDPPGPCGPVTDAFTLTLVPPLEVEAGPDLAACSGEAVALAGQVIGDYDAVIWSDNGAGGRFEPAPNVPDAAYYPPAAFSGSIALSLTATDEVSPCPAVTDTLTLTVHPTPTAGFSAVAACHRQAVAFRNESQYPGGTRFEWDFGDGAASTELSPSHVFPAPGSYEVTLTARTDAGCTSRVTRLVNVFANPEPDFTVEGSCAGQSLAFTNLSDLGEAGPAAYEWDFGDGAGSNEKDPVHTFAAAGAYAVRLQVTNAKGCTTTLSRELTLSPGPVAAFSAASVCEGAPTVFIQSAESAGASIVSYHWDFGDGAESTEANPRHTYAAAGTYPVTLTVTDSKGCAGTVEQEVEVWAPPAPAFAAAGGCVGQPVSFTNLSEAGAAPIEQYEWAFGDGATSRLAAPVHEYAAPGDYLVRLRVTDANGCTAEWEEPLAIGALPTAAFAAETVCAGEGTAFLNRSQAGGRPLERFEWQFGDGATSTELNPVHRYAAAGVYNVILTVFDAGGCSASTIATVEVLAAPVPDFSAMVSCGDGRVRFSDRSVSPAAEIVLYDWRFGDGSGSREGNPEHTYAAPGEYAVQLSVTDANGCSATLTRTVVVPAPPLAAFTATGSCAGDGPTVTVENDSRPAAAAALLDFFWIVRDARDREAARSRAAAPVFDLPPGEYVVELTVSEEGGCTAAARQPVAVYPEPKLSVEADAERVCQGESTTLTATLEGGAPCETIDWERAPSPAGPWQPLAGSAGETHAVAPDLAPGTYYFRAIYRCEVAGCGAVVSDAVTVVVGIGSPNLACNNNVQLTLDSDCRLEVSPNMVAEGAFGFCFPYREEDFEVIVYDGQYPGGEADPRVESWGVFPYKLQLKPAARQAGGIFEPCWGELTVTDLTPPEATCPPDVAGLVRDEKGEYRPALRPAGAAGEGETFHYLLCEEQERIYNEARSWEDPTYPYFTGRPTVIDACGEAVLIRVNDRIERPGCTEAALDFGSQIDSRLVRTFTYADAQGNTATCDQTIYFFRPRLQLPPCEVSLDWCRYGAAQDLDPVLTETAPFYYNALGERFWLTDFTCGFSVAYEDDFFPGEENCGFVLLRRWAILDDCRLEGLAADLIDGLDVTCPGEDGWRGNRFLFEQWLRVEDDRAPVVACPAPPDAASGWTFSTGPIGCGAVVAPAPPVVDGECRDWSWTFELYAFVVDPLTQLPEYRLVGISEGQRLTDVPPGEYDLIYLVRDACGNETRSARCPVVVVDGVEPIAICENELQVSLGSGNADGFGVATLLAETIGSGSRDECGAVELDIRRAIDAECLDTYVRAVTQTEVRFDALRPVEESDGTRITYYYGDRRLLVEEDGDYFSPWAASVFLTCCDAGAAGVAVELRATDRAGLRNVCASTVVVEDKLPPRCSAEDQVIACTELDFDPEDPAQVAARFGAPEAVVSVFDNCGATIEEALVWMPANCGRGVLERLFTVIDAGGQSAQCSQTITVEEVTDYALQLPGDRTLTGCGAAAGSDLTLQSAGCEMLAVSRDTLPFEAAGDACRRLMITYEVINWCEYDAVGNTTPTRIPRDADDDDRLDEGTWVVVAYDAAYDAVVAKLFGADAAGNPASPPLRVYQPGDPGYNPGYFTYTQFVDIIDENAPQIELPATTPVFCAAENECAGEYRLELLVRDDCPLPEAALQEIVLLDEAGTPLEAPAVERQGDRLFATGRLPIGQYALRVRLADACQNTAVATVDFRIEDCTAPAPICRGVLTADLSPVDTDNDGRFDAGAVTLPFDAFLAGAISDCSPFADEPLHQVRYFLSRQAPQTSADLQARELTFTCADEGVVEVYVTALDAAGNFGTCPVQVLVEPGNDPNPCEVPIGDGAVAGLISTEWERPVEEVLVRLSGAYSSTVTTDANGMYGFEGLQEGYDYTLAPLLDREYVNGVTTFDLLQISKHILAEDPLDSPYQLIAADANNSGTITSFDLIQLRKLILTLISDLPDNTSWRFVDGAHRFADPANPWKFYIPEVVNINDLAGRFDGKDFVAIKVGDVNGTARTTNLAAPEIRSPSGTLPLFTSDRELEPGATYRIPIRARDMTAVAGYQFTMEWDREALELVDLEYGWAQEEHFGVFPAEGALTTSWIHPRNGATASDAPLFTLVVRARRSARLSASLWLTSRYTPAEGYGRNGASLEVALHFERTASSPSPFELLPLRPNPWRDFTLVGFTLPAAAPAALQVLDVNGRLLQRIEGNFEQGYNEVRLDRRQLPAGVLYLTLESARQTATRKMILLD